MAITFDRKHSNRFERLMHGGVVFCQLSESPASLPLCPPAETAEINQYDLADALIDTEKSHREESLEPGCLSCHH